MINKIYRSKYKGQGFVEALIAILVGGIAVVALMSVTTRTLGQVAKNEMKDQLNQEAVLGSNMMDFIVEYRNNTTLPTDPFPGNFPGSVDSNVFTQVNANAQHCYELDGTLDNPRFGGVVPLCLMDPVTDAINPRQCILNQWPVAVIDGQPESKRDSLFRIACFNNETDFLNPNDDARLLSMKVFTGTVGCTDFNQLVTDFQSEDESCIVVQYTAIYPFNIRN